MRDEGNAHKLSSEAPHVRLVDLPPEVLEVILSMARPLDVLAVRKVRPDNLLRACSGSDDILPRHALRCTPRRATAGCGFLSRRGRLSAMGCP